MAAYGRFPWPPSGVARAGLRAVRFHDLRHTFGTRMAATGAPLRMIQEWMGHRDYKTTSLYADYAPDTTQGAAWARRAFCGGPATGAEARCLRPRAAMERGVPVYGETSAQAGVAERDTSRPGAGVPQSFCCSCRSGAER